MKRTLTRWIGLIGVGVRRTVSRATHTARGRVQFTVLGVAVAIALLVAVTGLGVGLATSTTVYDDDVDYWIVPENDGQSSPLIATDNPQFGSVHETHARLDDHDDVDSATPVLSQVLRVEGDETAEYVLVVGVIDTPALEQVSGIDTGQLTPDDPYYGDGESSGEWTGDVVLSESAATLLERSPEDPVTIAGNDSFTVRGVDEGTGGPGGVPTALVQLSELQALTGADAHDGADQFVVGTNSPAVQDDLEELYPQSSVLSRSELTASETLDSELPLALSVTAFVVSIAIGTLFVVTTSSLEVVADRRQLATLSAIGISRRSQLRLVGTQTLVLTGLGGLLGALGGLVGIRLINAIAVRTLTSEPIAVSHPLFVGYGVGVALLVGVLSLPILLLVTRRVSGGVP